MVNDRNKKTEERETPEVTIAQSVIRDEVMVWVNGLVKVVGCQQGACHSTVLVERDNTQIAKVMRESIATPTQAKLDDSLGLAGHPKDIASTNVKGVASETSKGGLVSIRGEVKLVSANNSRLQNRVNICANYIAKLARRTPIHGEGFGTVTS